MHKKNNDNLLLLLINFVNSRNSKFNLKVWGISNKNIVSKFDSNVFFKSGQLLMYIYITNMNNISRDHIIYKEGEFYIDIPMNCYSKEVIEEITSENIINNLIEKSTYNKEFLPINLNDVSEENLLDIGYGFEQVYNVFIKEKMSLIEFIDKTNCKYKYVIIKDIKLLNPHDLKRQLKLIRLKFEKKVANNKLVEKLFFTRYDKDRFIKLGKKLSDKLIQNSIVSLYDSEVQLMWMGYIDEKLQPIKHKNIYVAILFAYIGKITSEKYFFEICKKSLKPILNDFKNWNDNCKKLLDEECYEVLKLLYLLSGYTKLKELDEFVQQNTKLFNMITLEDKIKCDSKGSDLILEYMYNKSLDLFNFLILE